MEITNRVSPEQFMKADLIIECKAVKDRFGAGKEFFILLDRNDIYTELYRREI